MFKRDQGDRAEQTGTWQWFEAKQIPRLRGVVINPAAITCLEISRQRRDALPARNAIDKRIGHINA